MIPHRMLSYEITGSGLKDRVTACRKRLRERRVMLKAHANVNDVEEFFPEAAAALLQLPDFSATSDFEGAQQAEEQEVAIT